MGSKVSAYLFCTTPIRGFTTWRTKRSQGRLTPLFKGRINRSFLRLRDASVKPCHQPGRPLMQLFLSSLFFYHFSALIVQWRALWGSEGILHWPGTPSIAVELEDVFRLACFYFSPQKQNRNKARRFCTVGSRWCESPFDFCESTYSYDLLVCIEFSFSFS